MSAGRRLVVYGAVGQVLAAAALPFTALLHGAAAFGVFSVFLAVAQLLAVVATLRLEFLLPRYEPQQRRTVACRILILSIFVSSVGGVVTWFVESASLPLGLLMLALTWTTAFFSFANFAALAEDDLQASALLRVVNPALTGVLQVSLGYLAPGAVSLMSAYAIGSLASCVFAIRPMIRILLRKGVGAPLHQELRSGLVLGSSGLLSNASVNLPVLAAAALFGPSVAATFQLVRRLLSAPIQLLGKSLSDLNYVQLTSAGPSEIAARFKTWSRKLQWASIAFAVLALGVLIPLELLLGNEYPLFVPIYIGWLLPTVFQLPAVSLGNAMLAVSKERHALVWNAIRLAALGLWAATCSLLAPPELPALLALAFISTVSYLSLIWVTRRAVLRNE